MHTKINHLMPRRANRLEICDDKHIAGEGEVRPLTSIQQQH